MRNQYSGTCKACNAIVPPYEGTLKDRKNPLGMGRIIWEVYCDNCLKESQEKTETSAGWVGYRNRKGLCEDAPCCGCCTF